MASQMSLATIAVQPEQSLRRAGGERERGRERERGMDGWREGVSHIINGGTIIH